MKTAEDNGRGQRSKPSLTIDKEGRLYNDYEVLDDDELHWMNMKQVSERLQDNKRALQEQVGLDKSFDVLFREMTFGGKQTGLFYLNGFAKDDVLTDILVRLSYLKHEEIVPDTLKQFFYEYVPHIQVELKEELSEVIHLVLSGGSALFIEGEPSALVIDVKQFPGRSIEEPSLEKVVRGSRDGFVETLLTNVTLIRRRLRDPRLKFEIMNVGMRTRSDVCLAYINDIADLDTVEAVRDRINTIKVDGIPLAEKQLEEFIIGKTWNPYPQVRYSERPDVISAHLLEGHLVVLVDTSPSAMIIPSTFFHLVQHAEEYRQTPFMGTYLRWVRFLGIIFSLFLLPLWFLFVLEPELLPSGLEFIGPRQQARLPILLQFLIAELGVDLMRMAAVHTPTPLATAMGLIAAILIGDVAIEAGLFVNEVILYMSVAAIGMFATPSYELGLANRVVRLALLILVGFFKVPGLVVGTTLVMLMLVMTRSFNAPYMWPFIPFDARALLTVLIRRPVDRMKKRPSIVKATDETRQP